MQSVTLQPIQKTIHVARDTKRSAVVLPTCRQPLVQIPPEGYMTSEEFRKRAAMKVNTFCDKYGIL